MGKAGPRSEHQGGVTPDEVVSARPLADSQAESRYAATVF
jgi:hypothetical protein